MVGQVAQDAQPLPLLRRLPPRAARCPARSPRSARGRACPGWPTRRGRCRRAAAARRAAPGSRSGRPAPSPRPRRAPSARAEDGLELLDQPRARRLHLAPRGGERGAGAVEQLPVVVERQPRAGGRAPCPAPARPAPPRAAPPPPCGASSAAFRRQARSRDAHPRPARRRRARSPRPGGAPARRPRPATGSTTTGVLPAEEHRHFLDALEFAGGSSARSAVGRRARTRSAPSGPAAHAATASSARSNSSVSSAASTRSPGKGDGVPASEDARTPWPCPTGSVAIIPARAPSGRSVESALPSARPLNCGTTRPITLPMSVAPPAIAARTAARISSGSAAGGRNSSMIRISARSSSARSSRPAFDVLLDRLAPDLHALLQHLEHVFVGGRALLARSPGS